MKQYSFSETADGSLNTNSFALALHESELPTCSVEVNTPEAWFRVHPESDLSSEQETLLDLLVSQHTGTTTALRIEQLLDPQFSGYLPHKIDFRKHLLPGVHIQKDVEMLVNGRPSYALYKHNGTAIARIRFEFELNQFFLMERRKEILGYYLEGETDVIPEEYVISDEIYNLAESSYHLTKSMEERSTCRNYVLESMKATLNGFILQHYMGLGQEFMPILNTVSQFFNTYSTDLTTWLQTGAGNFKQVVLDDTTYDFLDLAMQPGFSVRAYIVYRLENA